MLEDGYPTQEEKSRAGEHTAKLGGADDIPVPLVRGHIASGEEGEETIQYPPVASEEGGDVLEQEHWRPVDAYVVECSVEQCE